MMVPMRTLNLLGYWRSEFEPDLPHPKDWVDATWNENERDAIIDYLDQGLVRESYRGLSPCRMCGNHNGYRELTDGTYVWPEGLAHYVRDHAVRLPRAFVEHALWRLDTLCFATADTRWWMSQTPPVAGDDETSTTTPACEAFEALRALFHAERPVGVTHMLRKRRTRTFHVGMESEELTNEAGLGELRSYWHWHETDADEATKVLTDVLASNRVDGSQLMPRERAEELVRAFLACFDEAPLCFTNDGHGERTLDPLIQEPTGLGLVAIGPTHIGLLWLHDEPPGNEPHATGE